MTDSGCRLSGTNLFKMGSHSRDRIIGAIRGLILLNSKPQGSIHTRLQKYREFSEILLMAYGNLSDINDAAIREIEQMLGATSTSHRKRWTAEEDAALIELATEEDEDCTMIRLALSLNRSPAAVSSRLTYLVGIHKVSQHVVGRLTGYLNGEPVRGYVDGVVTALKPPVEDSV